MTTTIKRLLTLSAACLSSLIASPAVAQQGLDHLRVAHLSEVRDLRLQHNATMDSLKASHTAAVEQLKCAERDARRLCEPERSRVLERIRRDRRAEANSYRISQRRERARFKLALRTIKSHYDLACESYRPVTLPCGCAVNHCTCRPTPALPNTRPICTLPAASVAPIRLDVFLPQVYRYQTVERIRRPAPTCTADRGRSTEWPIAHLLRTLLAEEF